jgi:hypothetical protein
MQKRNLVTVLALSVAFTAGCAMQASRGTKDGPEPTVFEFVHSFAGQGLAEAAVNIYVKCIPPAGTACLPAPDVYVTETDAAQNIVFDLRTAGRVFDDRGIQFDRDYFACDRAGDIRYTCRPNNAPRGAYLKYTIRVVNATPNDPYAFVRN